MPRIVNMRPVLLSAPYAHADSLEVRKFLKAGHRTCGLIEITLEDGTTGLGEGYVATFAPRVFVEIVKLVDPYLVNKEAFDIGARYRDACSVVEYWSLQGAARHVVGAFEIALVDAKAKMLGVPAYSLLGGKRAETLALYGGGGDSLQPEAMQKEIAMLESMGIDLFKIRVLNRDVGKTLWALEHAASAGIRVGVDMSQNLATPAQTVNDVVRYVETVHAKTSHRIEFLEEALGPADIESYPLLRSKLNVKICGGEIVTTAQELCQRVAAKLYDFVQPDATVIGGMGDLMEVISACRRHGSRAVVHCWGGAVCMMANYHAALAGGEQLAEWPMPSFPLREAMMVEPLRIQNGQMQAPSTADLGVKLAPEIEKEYAFREDAVYACIGTSEEVPPDSVWEMEAYETL